MSYSPTIDTTNNLVTLDQVKNTLGIRSSNAQVIDIVCDGEDEGGQLGGKYFLFATTLHEYYAWFDTGNASTDPGITNKTGVEINIAAGDTATTVASAAAAAITALSNMTAVSTGNTFTMTSSVAGDVTPPNIGNCSTFKLITQEAGTTGDETHDAVLIDLINDASWWFKNETHRILKAQSLTEYYDGNGGYIMYLRNPPVTGLTLYQDSDRSFAAATEISSDDYELDGTSGRIFLTGDLFMSDRHVIKAVYTGGYATIPYDLQRAALEMVAQNFLLTDAKAQSAESRSDDKGGTTRYLHKMSDVVTRALNRYAKTVVI